GTDEKPDLLLLHLRELHAHGLDQLLPKFGGKNGELAFGRKGPAARLEKDEDTRSAGKVRRHDGLREPRFRLPVDDFAGAADELIEQRPAVFGFNRLELDR